MITPEVYSRVFEGHAEGKLILEDLTARFHDNACFVPGVDGARQTDFNLGARAVVRFILSRIGQIHTETNDEA